MPLQMIWENVVLLCCCGVLCFIFARPHGCWHTTRKEETGETRRISLLLSDVCLLETPSALFVQYTKISRRNLLGTMHLSTAGQRLSKNDLTNRQCRQCSFQSLILIDHWTLWFPAHAVGSQPSFLKRSIDSVGSSPLFLNRS
jgi:hypothetical protein